jgi:hypothetical protein
MKRFFVGAGYGVVGLAVAMALTIGAYAVAGQDLSRPANPVGAGKDLGPARTSLPRGSEKSTARQARLGQHRQDQRQHQRELAQRQQERSQPTGSVPRVPESGDPPASSTDRAVSSANPAGPTSSDTNGSDGPGGSSDTNGSDGPGGSSDTNGSDGPGGSSGGSDD